MKIIQIVLVFLNVSLGFSQIQLKTSFNGTDAGRNFAFTISKSQPKLEYGGGVRININRLIHDNQNNVYRKRLYATKPYQYFGVQGYLHYRIFSQWEKISPFLFYDIQVTNATARREMYLPSSYYNPLNGELLYEMIIDFTKPFTWIEQNVGVGFRTQMTGRWSLEEKIGIGTNFILGYDDQIFNKIFKKFDWEFASLINVSLVYKLKE